MDRTGGAEARCNKPIHSDSGTLKTTVMQQVEGATAATGSAGSYLLLPPFTYLFYQLPNSDFEGGQDTGYNTPSRELFVMDPVKYTAVRHHLARLSNFGNQPSVETEWNYYVCGENLEGHLNPELAECIPGLRPLVEETQSVHGAEATECTQLIQEEVARSAENLFPGFTANFATGRQCAQGIWSHLDVSNHPYSIGVVVPIYSGRRTPRGVLPTLYFPDSETWVNLTPNEVALVLFQDKEHLVP
ncbi:hypothetical protein BDR26DRAFT_934544 [Obelidium mucronatum]|nr:hypothetical protein BDR26DRAFT_934544 [Obelidium mucronatum]